jgi:hypothetical protein
MIAGIELSYAAESAVRNGEVAIAGDFRAESADVDPALLLVGMALPRLGEGHAVSAAGRLEIENGQMSIALSEASFAKQSLGGSITVVLRPEIGIAGSLSLQTVSLPLLTGFASGAVPEFEEGWSDAPFAVALPPGISLDLALRADELDLGLPLLATDARLNLDWAEATLQVDVERADFAGGVLKGSLAATMQEGEADVSLSGGLTAGELQALVWERRGLPVASGTLDLSLEAQGRGRSMAAVVAGMTGSGSFAISDGRLNALNAEALAAVMHAAEGDEEPDSEAARETFASLFGSGALAFGRAAGSFSVDAGLMTIPKVAFGADRTAVLAGAGIDLNRLTLESDWTVRLEEGGQETQPSVEVAFSGPIAEPERRTDLTPLLDLLSSRFQQRQLDRLETLERERRQSRHEELQQLHRQAETEMPPPPEQPILDETLLAPAPPAGPEPPELGPQPPESGPQPPESEPEPTRARLEPPIQLVPPTPPQAAPPPDSPPPPRRPVPGRQRAFPNSR